MTDLPYTMRQLKALVANGRDLSLHELRVMLSLIVHADDGGECFPSNKTIGEPWGMTDSNVRAALRKLKAGTDSRPALIESSGVGGVSKSGTGIAAARRILLDDQQATRSESSRLESSRLEPNPVRNKPAISDGGTRSDSGREPGQILTSKETIEETIEEKDFVAELNRAIDDQTRRLGTCHVKAIYDAYPRKVAKPHALHAITQAIGRLDRDRERRLPEGVESWGVWLLNRVKTYAAGRARQIAADPRESNKHTPHPATWFNRERYDDDPGDWEPVQPREGGASDRPIRLFNDRPSPNLAGLRQQT